MKIFKWYIVSDFDDFIFRRACGMELTERIRYLEKINEEQYKEIIKLKEENLWLKNHQKIEIVNI